MLNPPLSREAVPAVEGRLVGVVRMSAVEIRESIEFDSTISVRESVRCSNSTDISSEDQ